VLALHSPSIVESLLVTKLPETKEQTSECAQCLRLSGLILTLAVNISRLFTNDNTVALSLAARFQPLAFEQTYIVTTKISTSSARIYSALSRPVVNCSAEKTILEDTYTRCMLLRSTRSEIGSGKVLGNL
jgi:hypothetical protein